MQSRCYGAIVEHKFSCCQGEDVAEGSSPQRALRTRREGFHNRVRAITLRAPKRGQLFENLRAPQCRDSPKGRDFGGNVQNL
jgi:hypothetical protein